MIKSKFFLDSIINKIKQANNFDFFQDEIVDFIESENNVLVKTKSNQFLAITYSIVVLILMKLSLKLLSFFTPTFFRMDNRN